MSNWKILLIMKLLLVLLKLPVEVFGFIFFVVFEFRGVGGNFLVGNTGVEASIDSILLDLADDAFVGVVLLVFATIGAYLNAHDLNQPLNFLFVDRLSPVLQLQMDPSIAVVFVFASYGQNLVFLGLVLIFFVPLFLPVHKGGFGKVDGGEGLC